eukprot:CAMPEP_0172414886 /NCGR_PEP_ID=MMETSP1064-20121228/1494_1 /TAXON_ID=202472 /ORGANISM="Aulacoseira subarctica , Strain CCAP 1002/5" /LENGTH=148 /DNA_ID=CAMNT_0013151747 /DNA_START=102 /DNA_END=545 /DNA_ORIENTATION=+
MAGGSSSILLLLQLCGLLSSWFGAFQLGAVVKHQLSLSTSAAPPASSLRNEVCNSSIEDTERHQFTATFDDVTDGDLVRKVLLHPQAWAGRILSYHCRDDETTGDLCVAILQGGGHLIVEHYKLYERIDVEIYSGCGLLWKRADTRVS